MGEIRPENLVLRCYGYKKRDRWHGVCIDLNLAVEANSAEHLNEKMGEVISSYIDTVIDTEDAGSVPDLISRKAPLRDFLIYYLIRIAISFHEFRRNITFKKIIPFHLAHSC